MVGIVSLLLLLFVTSCGRKKKDIFSFDSKPRKVALASLAFRITAIKGGKASRDNNKICIEWDQVDEALIQNPNFLGYNVYRLRSWGIIPKQPLNKLPIKQLFFVDKKPVANEFCYVVRAIVQDGKKTILGPASKIICIQ